MIISLVVLAILIILLIGYYGNAAQQKKARYLQDEHERLIQQAEAEAREKERESAKQSLFRSGAVINRPGREYVSCSNGHRYLLDDFCVDYPYEDSETYEDGVIDTNGLGKIVTKRRYFTHHDWRAECPLCKSTSWRFEDSFYNNYRECRKCGYWFLKSSYSHCPYCAKERNQLLLGSLLQRLSHLNHRENYDQTQRTDINLKGTLTQPRHMLRVERL